MTRGHHNLKLSNNSSHKDKLKQLNIHPTHMFINVFEKIKNSNEKQRYICSLYSLFIFN